MIQNVKKMLAPIDFSQYSMDALNGAAELARDIGAELHLLHVVAPHHSLFEQESTELVRETAMVEQTEEELARIKKDVLGNSDQVVTAVVIGPPTVKIIEYARDKKIDLILMATHGHTGAEHLLIGSVAEKVARMSPCSVLVFRRRAQ
jgi:nucleotide-binding universal stress UspA family protein